MSDGLVNGARGEVVHVVTNRDNKVTNTLVKSDSTDVGNKAKHATRFTNFYNVVNHQNQYF